jgi:hypothetical protein
VLEIVLKQLRKFQFVADWLDFRAAKLESRELRARHQKGLEEAKKTNAGREEYEAINSQYRAESEIIWDPIYIQESDRLVTRARKYGIRVPVRPTGNEDNQDWILSYSIGDWFLTGEAERKLKHEIRIERRQSYDEFRKWATVGFAFLAFVLGVMSLSKKEKQPDPCPRNYYRSDSGECVLALRKTEAPGPPRQSFAQPSASPAQAKPSPAYP